jgi:hypothetical protein
MPIHEAAARGTRPRGTEGWLCWRRMRGHLPAPRHGGFQIIRDVLGRRCAITKIEAVLARRLPEDEAEGVQFIAGSLKPWFGHGAAPWRVISITPESSLQPPGPELMEKRPGYIARICAMLKPARRSALMISPGLDDRSGAPRAESRVSFRGEVW